MAGGVSGLEQGQGDDDSFLGEAERPSGSSNSRSGEHQASGAKTGSGASSGSTPKGKGSDKTEFRTQVGSDSARANRDDESRKRKSEAALRAGKARVMRKEGSDQPAPREAP